MISSLVEEQAGRSLELGLAVVEACGGCCHCSGPVRPWWGRQSDMTSARM